MQIKNGVCSRYRMVDKKWGIQFIPEDMDINQDSLKRVGCCDRCSLSTASKLALVLGEKIEDIVIYNNIIDIKKVDECTAIKPVKIKELSQIMSCSVRTIERYVLDMEVYEERYKNELLIGGVSKLSPMACVDYYISHYALKDKRFEPIIMPYDGIRLYNKIINSSNKFCL